MNDLYVEQLALWFNGCPEAIGSSSGGVDFSLVGFMTRKYLGRDCSMAVILASPNLDLSTLPLAVSFVPAV